MDLTPSHAGPSEEENTGAEQQQAPSATTAAAPAAAPAPASAPAPPSPTTVPLDRSTASRTGKEIGGKKFRVGAGDDYVPFRSRTKRRRRLVVTGIVAAILLAMGGYGAVSLLSPPAQKPAASGCSAKGGTTAAAQAIGVRLPTASQIRLNVYNSTNRQGLAAATATQLKQRGFTIVKVTNDPLKANLSIPAQIRGGANSSPAMRVVAAEVTGSQLKPDTRIDDSVDLVLGTGFTSLASPEQVAAALKAAAVTAKKTTGGCAG